MTTCLIDRRARLLLHAGRLTVQRPDTANSYLPLGQIERLVIRATEDPALQALLMLVEAGRPVHFIDAHGQPLATLTPHGACNTQQQTIGERLTNSLFRNGSADVYRRWLDNQRSHTCSRLIKHTRSRDWPRVEAAVNRYLLRAVGNAKLVAPLLCELRGLLWAWLDARFQRLGLIDTIEVLEGRDCHFQTDVETLLALPMKSWLTPIIRERPNVVVDVAPLFTNLETRLDQRLWLHLNALSATLNSPQRQQRSRRK